MGPAGAEPQLFAGERGHVVGDHHVQAGPFPQGSGEVDVAPSQEGPLADDRSITDHAAEGDADAVQ
jgi:hypothetical protein